MTQNKFSTYFKWMFELKAIITKTSHDGTDSMKKCPPGSSSDTGKLLITVIFVQLEYSSLHFQTGSIITGI